MAGRLLGADRGCGSAGCASYSQWWLTEIYAAAGETDMALDELESILAGPLPGGPGTIALDPWLHTLADNPRFKELTGGG